jgi:nucleotide-binding universal stress UspA family protein
VNADIEVFHVTVDADRLIAAPEEIAIQHLRDRDEGTAEARAAAVRTIYREWRAGLPEPTVRRVAWREMDAAEEAAVTAEATSFDLIVLPRTHNMDSGDGHHAAVRQSHRPLLVAPDQAIPYPVDFARSIAIAWKPGVNTQRAVEGSAAWLRSASSVRAIMVAPNLDQGGWPELERLTRQLGFEVAPVLIPPDSASVAEHILRAVDDLHAGCIVLGSYRHSDLIEWALPSTTRFILNHAKVPLFMAH